MGGHELDVAELLEVPPEGPEDQGGLVFLDGQTRRVVLQPRVPRRCQGPIGVVLVQEVTVLVDDLGAEIEEPPWMQSPCTISGSASRLFYPCLRVFAGVFVPVAPSPDIAGGRFPPRPQPFAQKA